jgi:hypothetical protein
VPATSHDSAPAPLLYQYLPACQTAEEAVDWAAERGLVALLEGRGPDGLFRGLALDPDVAAEALALRGLHLVRVAEEMRPGPAGCLR